MVGDKIDKIVISSFERFLTVFSFDAVTFGLGCVLGKGGEEGGTVWLGECVAGGASDAERVRRGCRLVGCGGAL